ncbi:MAG TPA: nucleoside monophosphate kinase [Tenericutes bacterium]|nr:nucleoside monophosphate kinase [Mycoplasmatota bacterium]
MKNMIFIAPPAAGKGTQSKIFSEKYNIPHISTGDLLRQEITCNTPTGKLIKSKIENGEFVDDDIMYELLYNRLKENDCSNGYILDGFPRNVEQAISYEKILESLNKELGYVFLLDIPREIAKERILGRLSCSKCGKVYNETAEYLLPNVSGICDICNSPLTRRKDDTLEVFEDRYNLYLLETKPLIEYYNKKGNLYVIDSSINAMYTKEQIEKIIKGS